MGITYLNRIRERHLFGRGDTLSKFHCENVMKKCINMALELPDFSYREKDGKYVHIKHFQFSRFGISVYITRKFINIFKIKKKQKTPHQ